ncbi:MAG: hypothetical protein DRN21_06400 [Thermoplasmata archaeon]|nr:MAG: hypothetical protein DRN21_06400 [Thermoplasmata archaeon]
MSLIKKCPVCNSDALLQDSKPVFSEGCYSKIYRCEKGHVWRVKIYFRGIKRTVTEILEGEDNGSVQNNK